MKTKKLIRSHQVSRTIFSTILSVSFALLVAQNTSAAETPPETESASLPTSVTIDHNESSRISTRPGAQEMTQNGIEYADESMVNKDIEYDHCHFDAAHAHHHCYDAGEHEHERNLVEADQVYISESRANPDRRYRYYTTRRSSNRYYSTHAHSNSHQRNYSHERYNSQNQRDNWNSVALGLAIGLPLAYSNRNYNRGHYRARGHGFGNRGFGNRGFSRGWGNRGGYNRGGNHGGNRRGRH
jgi:hypothetical protein